jgi:hypothetical protein
MCRCANVRMCGCANVQMSKCAGVSTTLPDVISTVGRNLLLGTQSTTYRAQKISHSYLVRNDIVVLIANLSFRPEGEIFCSGHNRLQGARKRFLSRASFEMTGWFYNLLRGTR